MGVTGRAGAGCGWLRVELLLRGGEFEDHVVVVTLEHGEELAKHHEKGDRGATAIVAVSSGATLIGEEDALEPVDEGLRPGAAENVGDAGEEAAPVPGAVGGVLSDLLGRADVEDRVP